MEYDNRNQMHDGVIEALGAEFGSNALEEDILVGGHISDESDIRALEEFNKGYYPIRFNWEDLRFRPPE